MLASLYSSGVLSSKDGNARVSSFGSEVFERKCLLEGPPVARREILLHFQPQFVPCRAYMQWLSWGSAVLSNILKKEQRSPPWGTQSLTVILFLVKFSTKNFQLSWLQQNMFFMAARSLHPPYLQHIQHMRCARRFYLYLAILILAVHLTYNYFVFAASLRCFIDF